MKLSFKRITSSGQFIPEIDGLRFIAIASVLIFHISGFIVAKDTHTYNGTPDFSYLTQLFSHGHLGVPLFFVISGLILGIPFAKWHILKKEPVLLKKYFLRRLTRLEPPYILCMTLLFLGSVYVAKTLNLTDAVHSYFASVFYMHNIIYPGVQPLLNGPAWSLEIEIQFYILTPLLAWIIFSHSARTRRAIMVSAIISLVAFNQLNPLPFICLINYLHYFITGFLLADLYTTKSKLFTASLFDRWFSVLLLLLIWIFDSADFTSAYQKAIWELTQLAAIFLLYYLVLFHNSLRFLSNKHITNIGGMCYSIYLLHYPIISLLGNKLVQFSFSDIAFINVAVYVIVIITAVMSVSSLYFLLVERPCMQREWYVRFFSRKKKTPVI